MTTRNPSNRVEELDELLELEELPLELELLLELELPLELELLLEPGEVLLELPELSELTLELLEPGGLPAELDELEGGTTLDRDERLELDPPP